MDAVVAMTERLLVDAGVGPGMRVLDAGCGRGDVSFLAARLVGAQGQVLGVDRDSDALAIARQRAREPGDAEVRFEEADLSALSSDLHGQLDAVVGRRVLMYQRDPIEAIRQLARTLRPGGLVVFQEHDTTMVPASIVPLPLHERAHGWMWRTVELEGGNLQMGFQLASVFERAGLTAVQVRAEAVVHTPAQASTLHHTTGKIIRAMLPRIIRQGVATEAEIDVDTLDQRLTAERLAANATYVSDMVFGAWARKPE
jgi:ubiquinone/menaquinone biosynthesis C-methylase UbiE